MRVLGMAVAGVLVLTAPIGAYAVPQGPKTGSAGTGVAAGTAQVGDGHRSNWRPAPGSRGSGWRPPQWGPSQWGPNRYSGGWVPYAGPGVPTYWVWGSQAGAWDYPFADWRGPDGGWGNP
jgi:hypothetical protein